MTAAPLRLTTVSPPRPFCGFTLVELLVVVAIIGILCLLVLTSVKSISGTADSAKCASNLRSVGQAISFYVNDSSYMAGRLTLTSDWFPAPGQLPGPLNHGQMPVSSWQYKSMLAYLLSPYLGLPEPTSATNVIAPVLQCPSWKKQAKNQSSACYLAPNAIVYQGQTIQPFGYPASGGNALVSPMRMVALPPVPLSEIMVLQDIDQKNAGAGAFPYDSLPQKPIHNGKRNCLYLDGHVGSQ